MKKQKRGQFLIGIVMLLIACGWVTYRVMAVNSTPSEELAPEARIVAILENGGCISCHSANPELPFYASIPVAGDMVKADIEEDRD